MSNISVYSSTPRTSFRGVRDDSAVNLAMPVESLPIRLPLFFTLAPWGEEDRARYCDAGASDLLYGVQVRTPGNDYFTHQNVFIRSQFTGGGKALLQRVAAPNAKRASSRLAVDVSQDQIPIYERNDDGTLRLDPQTLQPIPTGETRLGHRLRWYNVPFEDGPAGFGLGAPMDGQMVNGEGDVSTIIPWTDFEGRHRGQKGNNLGYRLIWPTTASLEPANLDRMEELQTGLYRFQQIERSTASSVARTKPTINGEQFVEFSFKPNVVDITNNTRYSAGKVIRPAYESNVPSSFTGFGNFSRLHVYDARVRALLTTLAEAEADFTGEEIEDPYLINALTGVDARGVPYHTFIVEGPVEGGLQFGEISNHFMAGGSDGDVGVEAYNTIISDLLDGLADSQIPYRSIARMPFDSVWDSGFPVETKLKFANFHNLRPDVFIHVCTQDVLEPLNTPSQDSSIAVTLRSNFRAMQESSEFGTKALRFALFGGAGYLIGDQYDGLVPFMEFICRKGAEYMGAENGEMDAAYSFGRGENNILTGFYDHNGGWKPDNTRNNDWNNGLNYVEWSDMEQLFYPGLQSIYENHTSVLHSYFNTQIACNLTRIGHIVWRELSGDDKLTDDEFLTEVNNRVTAKTTGKYDGRVDITPNAHYTKLDTDLGFSWHLDIEMAGENIRTVEHLAIIAQRRRNEETA